MLRWLFVLLVGVHALIHMMGFVHAFGLVELPQLTQPISRPLGLLWLLAALLGLATVLALSWWPRGWWMIGIAALLLSQLVIISSWTDAKFGTVANVILAIGVTYGGLTQGPASFRAAFEHEATRGLARVRALPDAPLIAEADLAALPEPVQRYLRATGVVGQPRTFRYRLHFRGRIRGGVDQPWMPFEAEQQSFADQPTRLFLMSATRAGLPVQAFHRFADEQASFQVRLAGLVSLVDARGPELTRAETVTLFNDMCLLAPGTLLSPDIAWEPIDDHSVRARFTLGQQTITATLLFDDDGLLRDFVSDDRLRSRDDGSFVAQRFSTPVLEYGSFGPLRLVARGEARWHAPAPEGEFAYGEFELLDIEFDPRARPMPQEM